MTRHAVVATLTLAGLCLTAGCAAKNAAPAAAAPEAERQAHDVITLLRDDATRTVGRAVVSSARGAVELTTAGAWTQVAAGSPPTPAAMLSPDQLRSRFEALLAFLPAPALRYTLYFRFDSETLTPDSVRLLSEITRAAHGRADAEIRVIGHTDRSGPADANLRLGLKRAEAVRAALSGGPVDPAAIHVTSHGEAEPLVATSDGVFEARNRRVEVLIR